MEDFINSNVTLDLNNGKSNLDAVLGLTNPLSIPSDTKSSVGSVSNLVTASNLATPLDISTNTPGLTNDAINTIILPLSSISQTQTSISSSNATSKSSTAVIETDLLTGITVNESLVDNSKPDLLTNPSASQTQTLPDILPDIKTNILNTSESGASVSLIAEESQVNTDSTSNDDEQAKEIVRITTDQFNKTEASITANENVAIASASNITDSNQTPTSTNVTVGSSSTSPLISTDNKTLADSTNSGVTPAEVTAITSKDSGANPTITTSINSTAVDVTKTTTTTTNAQNITQLTSPSFSFNTGVFKVDETGTVGIDYLFDGGGYEGELGIFSLDGMEELAQTSDAFITEAARRSVSNSNLGYVVINDATEGARFSGVLPYDTNHNKGEYKGVKTFTMRPGDTFSVILVPNRATLQQVANNTATGDDMRPLFSLPMANPNGSFMTGQIADVTGIGNTFVMEDLRVDKPGIDSDYNDIIFQVRGATGSAVSIDSVIDLNKDWRPTNLGKALIEYAKPYVTPENPKVGELVTDELYDTVFGNKDNQVDNNSKTGAIAPEVPKSDSSTITTAPATSEPAKTENNVTSTNSGAIAPAIEKPSVSVVETSPVADKTAVTSESQNQPLDSGATTTILPQQPVVTAESSSSVKGDGGAIASNTTPTNPDPVVATDNNLGAIAPVITKPENPVIDTSSVTSSSSNSTNTGGVTETQNQSLVVVTDATGTNSVATDNPLLGDNVVGAIASTTTDTNSASTTQSTVVKTSDSQDELISAIATTTLNNNSASNTQPTVVEAVANEGEGIGTIISTPQETNSASTTQLTVNVDDWVEQAKKDLAAVISQGNTGLDNFQTELTNINNNLSDLAVNLAGEIDTTQNNISNQLYAPLPNLAQSQANLNLLWNAIASTNQKTVDQINSLESEIKIAQDTFNANPLHTSIQNANSEMNRYFSNTWDALYPNRGLYPDTWSQVESLSNYHKQASDQYIALIGQSYVVFDNAWIEHHAIGYFRQIAINNAISEYSTIATQLNDSWNQYSALQNNRDIIFNNAWSDYYNLNQQRWQIVSNAWNEHNALKNSWNEWGSDTEAQIDTWAKILKSEDRWYIPSDDPRNSGLPLIGIIDTGFSANHLDIDDSRITLGKDWVDGDTNPMLQAGEGNEHGSKILEIIAGTRNNGIGIDGINDRSPLWLGRAVGSNDWAQSLIEYVDTVKASGQPNAIVNLSFDLTQTNADGSIATRYELTALERAALTYAQQNKVLIVTATGNQGSTMSALGQAVKQFDNIITVGAAKDWNRADYSSYAEVDYANYGKGVDLLAQGTASNGISGTSVAAAKVTGAASLLWSANPNLNYTQIIDILKRTATDFNTPGWDAQTGSGLLNITAAVHLAKATKPEVYAPPSFNLVQDTLENFNIPEVYWPEFYNYYYYSDLEAKLTGLVWNNVAGAIASERATATIPFESDQNPTVGPNIQWDRDPVFSKFYHDWKGKEKENEIKKAHEEANKLRQALKYPETLYVHYKVTHTDGSSRAKVWRGIDLDAKTEYERQQREKAAAEKLFNDTKAQIVARQTEATRQIGSLQKEIEATELALQKAVKDAQLGQAQNVAELRHTLQQLQEQQAIIQATANQSIANLQQVLVAADQTLQQTILAMNESQIQAEKRLRQEIEKSNQEIQKLNKGFLDSLGNSVKGFVKNIGEGLKSALDKINVGAVLDLCKKIPLVSTVVNGIEGLIALAQGDWKQVVKNGINAALGLIPGGTAIPEKLVNILVDVGWTIADKNYKQGLKDVLKELEVENKVANTFVDVAWSMKDGNWKDVLGTGLSSAGFNNADKFVSIAWGMKDGDYTKALTAGLEVAGLDKLSINSNQAKAFVNSALALKDNLTSKVADELLSVAGTQFANSSWVQDLKDSNPNNDRAAVAQGLSAIGFKNVDQWVNMAWDIKGKNYLNAISTGFSLAGFSQGKDWVDMAWSLQQGDYFKVLSTGFKVAGFQQGQHLAKAAVNLREGKYLDAFFEGMYMVPGVGDLVNAFKAVGDGNFNGVANSLAKVATNTELLSLLVS